MNRVRKGTIDEIVEVSNRIPELQDPYGSTEYEKRFKTIHLILMAEIDGKLAGFKCGYQRDQVATKFYSWMGGVLPEYRKSGVAARLLAEMESWCKANGFDQLEFKTLNEHKGMLIFSLKHGFDIIDVLSSPKERYVS